MMCKDGAFALQANVRYWPLADIGFCTAHVPKADIGWYHDDPFECASLKSARCLVLSLGGGNRIYQAAVSKKLYQSMLGRRVRIRGKIMIVRTSTVLSVASLIAAFASPPVAAGEWPTKEEAIAMVQRAMVFIKQQGRERAYAEITKKAGPFHDRDLYVTVLDLDGKVLASGQSKNLIGRNLINARDPDGKLYIKERVELAREQSAFSQNYKWLNPATKEIEPQETYCERLDDIMVCGSVYSF